MSHPGGATIVAVEQVPIRELRNFTRRMLDRVKAGEVIGVTDRGRAVARLVPVELDRWDELRALGLLEPAEEPGDPLEFEPLPPKPGVPLASEIIQRLREDDRR